MMGALTLGLIGLLGLVFLACGIGLSVNPNPKWSKLGNAFAADIFLTLGLTTILGTLASCFPRSAMLAGMSDRMFTKLWVISGILAIVLFVVLIVLL